jgi:hypothetical protein
VTISFCVEKTLQLLVALDGIRDIHRCPVGVNAGIDPLGHKKFGGSVLGAQIGESIWDNYKNLDAPLVPLSN